MRHRSCLMFHHVHRQVCGRQKTLNPFTVLTINRRTDADRQFWSFAVVCNESQIRSPQAPLPQTNPTRLNSYRQLSTSRRSDAQREPAEDAVGSSVHPKRVVSVRACESDCFLEVQRSRAGELWEPTSYRVAWQNLQNCFIQHTSARAQFPASAFVGGHLRLTVPNGTVFSTPQGHHGWYAAKEIGKAV